MIAVVLAILAAVVLLAVLHDHRSDDPRLRHPSTGGATLPCSPRQPCHVHVIRRGEVDQ